MPVLNYSFSYQASDFSFHAKCVHAIRIFIFFKSWQKFRLSSLGASFAKFGINTCRCLLTVFKLEAFYFTLYCTSIKGIL